jgi:hypothetical protein
LATFIADNHETTPEVEAEAPKRSPFSWSAAIAGATTATALTGLLLLFGGLLSAIRNQDENTWNFAAAIYFVSSYAFGFFAGGYLVGRLTGVQTDSPAEESFRAAAHGLVAWGLAGGIWISAFALSLGEPGAAAEHVSNAAISPTSYWVDTLFRPQAPNNRHASLDGVQFAQADTGQSTDATTSPPPSDETQTPPTPNVPLNGEQYLGNAPDTSPPNERLNVQRNVVRHTPGDLAPEPQPLVEPSLEKLVADKSEVGRMLDADLAQGGYLSVDDRDRAAQLIAQDANLSYEDATTRVNSVQGRIRAQKDAAATMLHHQESMASLWLSISLLIGAVTSVFAAVFARREHDLESILVMLQPRK